MLDFIYDRPKVDFIFCMENQFDVFKRNDTFQAALNQMKVELPGKYALQYVLNQTVCILKSLPVVGLHSIYKNSATHSVLNNAIFNQTNN